MVVATSPAANKTKGTEKEKEKEVPPTPSIPQPMFISKTDERMQATDANNPTHSHLYSIGLEPIFEEDKQIVGIVETIFIKTNKNSFQNYTHSIGYNNNNSNTKKITSSIKKQTKFEQLNNEPQRYSNESMYNLISTMLTRSLFQCLDRIIKCPSTFSINNISKSSRYSSDSNIK